MDLNIFLIWAYWRRRLLTSWTMVPEPQAMRLRRLPLMISWSRRPRAGDGGAAQVFDGLVERLARLFAQDLSQQDAERTQIAAQWRFLQLAGGGLKLGQTLRPVGWGPKRGHRLLCT